MPDRTIPKEVKILSKIFKKSAYYEFVDNKFLLTDSIIAIIGPAYLVNEEFFKAQNYQKMSENMKQTLLNLLNENCETIMTINGSLIHFLREMFPVETTIDINIGKKHGKINCENGYIVLTPIHVSTLEMKKEDHIIESVKNRKQKNKKKGESYGKKEKDKDKVKEFTFLRKNPFANL